MSIESPFTITRFEYEHKHLYYLPRDTFTELENPIPTYLVGSRGTGKTTLLKALNWHERLQNRSLQDQLHGELFAGRYIGVYLKLPEIQLENFGEWLAEKHRNMYGTILGLYLDLIWIELVADAIGELMTKAVFSANPAQEHACVREMLTYHPNCFASYLAGKGPFTLKQFSAAIRQMRRDLERLAMRKGDLREVIESFPLDQLGSFGRFVGKSLVKLCDTDVAGNERGWHFKVCMDEGECLNSHQQKILNTTVRLGQWPVFFVVAFVSLPEDPITTLVPNVTLQKADRQLKNMDAMDDREFRDLAKGVATVRVQMWLQDFKATFDIDRIFGPLDINGILLGILERSVRPGAKKLLARAIELASHPFFSERETTENANEQPTGREGRLVYPIYQTYLIQKLDLPLPASPETPGWERRRQDSAELRKRMVGAYLSICYEFGTDVRYASGDMLLQMSDKCIRDLLSQVEEVLHETGQSLAEFLAVQVPLSKQDAAFKRASEKKKESLPKSGVRAPVETGRIVDALARITAIVQSRGRGNQHLLSSERGLFEVQCQPTGRDDSEVVLGWLMDAAEAGFLKFIVPDGNKRAFRVHTSLAPAYGFSYRGAYYRSRVTLSDIHRLAKTEDPDDQLSLVAEIGNRLAGQEIDDLPLFRSETK